MAKIIAFVDAHAANANSVHGRAYRAVNATLNNLGTKFNNAHNYLETFRAQALTDNRVQRNAAALTDAAIRAFTPKIASGKTAALLYA